jgi:hypothetical protein
MSNGVPSLLDYLREDPTVPPDQVIIEQDGEPAGVIVGIATSGPHRRFPCTGCGLFSFAIPTECYWCRRGR